MVHNILLNGLKLKDGDALKTYLNYVVSEYPDNVVVDVIYDLISQERMKQEGLIEQATALADELDQVRDDALADYYGVEV